MRRGFVAFFALSLVGVGLTGCGLFRFEQREPWRAQAEEACLAQRLVQPSAYMALSSKIDGPGVCGIDHPFKVAAFTGGSIGLKSNVTLACPIIPRIDTWLDEIVKPAAMMYFGVPVLDVKAGSYSCRPRNNQRGAKVSEHAFGNALDVMAFILADGREITVVKGWRGDPAEQEFLREAFVGACRYFNTVSGTGVRPVPSRPSASGPGPAQSHGATDGCVSLSSSSNLGSTQSRAGLRPPWRLQPKLPPSIWKTTSKALNRGAASMSRVDQGKQGARASPPTFPAVTARGLRSRKRLDSRRCRLALGPAQTYAAPPLRRSGNEPLVLSRHSIY